MIAGLRGNLEAVGPDWAIVNVQGVSFRVSVPSSAVPALGAVGSAVHLHTHLIVRDDALELHGFPSDDALRLFTLLIGVSGIGPRLAHSMLSAMTADTLAAAIAAGDTRALAQAPGLGQRTAARVIVELKDKLDMGFSGGAPGVPTTGAADAVTEALQALGYSAIEARQAAAGGDATLPVEEQVRQALQRFAQR
ncbi:MAG: Holliday junction branch migration protein RuvA [Chloroflexota bacterium]|nr:Holliday junction branch migration protein RuvA [Chloroflexota bacterium]MDE2969942.1 Holliday junction branch migration protein RuvA [Chloroflexota bacterium]